MNVENALINLLIQDPSKLSDLSSRGFSGKFFKNKKYRKAYEMVFDRWTRFQSIPTEDDFNSIDFKPTSEAIPHTFEHCVTTIHEAKVKEVLQAGLIQAGSQLVAEGPAPTLELMRTILSKIPSLENDKRFTELSETTDDFLARYHARALNKGKMLGVPLGFPLLDAHVRGLLPQWLVVIQGRNQMGKCQPVGSKVMLGDGTWTTVENIRVGDIVLSPQRDGSICRSKVIDTCSYENEDIYEIRLRGTDYSYKCSGNHILPFMTNWWSKKALNGKTSWVCSKDIKEMTVTQYLTLPKYRRRFTYAFTTPPIELLEKDLPVDPYTLGCLLGDGCLRSKDPSITYLARNEAMVTRMQNGGTEFNVAHHSDNVAVRYAKTTVRVGLSQLGLLGTKSATKFVPEVYKRASLQQRLNLLAGLIDTDGDRDNFYTTSPQLAQDFKDLVFSVGGFAEIRPKKTKCNGKTFDSLVVSYRFYSVYPTLSLTYKQKHATQHKPYHTFDVTPAGKGTVYGFTLDSTSQWYITDNHLVTHNSWIVSHMIKTMYLEKKNIALFSVEMSREEFENRIYALMMGLNPREVDFGELRVGDYNRMQEFIDEIKNGTAGGKLYIDDNPMDLTNIALKVEEIQANRGPLDVIIIDAAYDLNAEGASEREKFANIASGCKNLAKKYNLPVVVSIQANRDFAKANSNGKKNISAGGMSAYGSDKWNQVADLMFLIHSTEDHDPFHYKEFNMDKFRHGPKLDSMLRVNLKEPIIEEVDREKALARIQGEDPNAQTVSDNVFAQTTSLYNAALDGPKNTNNYDDYEENEIQVG